MRIAVLCAVFNRRQTTIRGLTTMSDSLALTPHIAEFFVLDDNSPDGTADGIAELFPDVKLVFGDGNLFWNRGMCRAFEASLASQAFDAYVLFNDDVEVFPEAASNMLREFEKLNSVQPTIIVGATVSRYSGDTTYSAFHETSKWRALAFESIGSVSKNTVCDTFNGNFVVVPGQFFRDIGGLDSRFHHGLGDIDLGLVAKKHGIQSMLVSGAVGYCEKGPDPNVKLANANFVNRWKLLFSSPNGLGPYLHFVRKHRPIILLPVYLTLRIAKSVHKLFAPLNAAQQPTP
jgi:GT2 family glycosyltransferase